MGFVNIILDMNNYIEMNILQSLGINIHRTTQISEKHTSLFFSMFKFCLVTMSFVLLNLNVDRRQPSL